MNPRKIKAGDVYVHRAEYRGNVTTTTTLVTSASSAYRVSQIVVSTIPEVTRYTDKTYTFKDSITGDKADWTAWADAVAKLTDYLLALPSEVME